MLYRAKNKLKATVKFTGIFSKITQTIKHSIFNTSNIFLRISICLVLFISLSTVNWFLTAAPNASQLKERADAEIIARNLTSAIEYYRQSLTVNPNFAPAMVGLGVILRRTGSLAESEIWLERALKLDNNAKTAYELARTRIENGRLDSANSLVQKYLKQKPYDPDFNVLNAEILMKKNRVELAIRRLQNIVRGNPDSLRAWLALSRCYRIKNNSARAAAALRKAVLISPEDSEVIRESSYLILEKQLQNLSSDLYLNPVNQSDFSETLRELSQSRALDPENVDANLMTAKVYTLTGECEAALPFIDNILRVNQNHEDALYYKAYCEGDNSEQIFEKLLTLNSNNELLRFAYQRELLRKYNRREHPAITSQARHHFQLAETLMKSSLIDQAMDEVFWSIYLFPAFVPPHETLLRHYRASGDIDLTFGHLNFLYRQTKENKYRDMLEQLVEVRRKRLAYKFSIQNIDKERNPTPFFIFDLKPASLLSELPGTGRILAERFTYSLERKGRLNTLDAKQREQIHQIYKEKGAVDEGSFYAADALSNLRKVLPGSNVPRYVGEGTFSRIYDGVQVNFSIIDLNTGNVLARTTKSASGKGYLRQIAVTISSFVYDKIPWQGSVIRISGSNLLINLGKIDGISPKDRLLIMRNGKVFAELKISQLEPRLLLAQTVNPDDIYKIRLNDIAVKKK